MVFRGTIARRFRTVPIGSRVVFFDLSYVEAGFEIQRVGLRRLGTICQVDLGFVDQRLSYTRAFERYALDLSRRMTI